MTWPVVVIMAVVFGVYTALMAAFVPDGNSFHDIAVTPEWWILPAILIIVNCKKPLDSALKVFAFFLISQPLVYLIQVPISSMGWGLFGYYQNWIVPTLLTFPAAFIGWYMKKDKWYSGVILSLATSLLVLLGMGFIRSFEESFPNHLLTTIYCFGIIPIFIFGIFKKKEPRIITVVITAIALIIIVLTSGTTARFEVATNSFLEGSDIVLVGEPYISSMTSEDKGNVTLRKTDVGYFVTVSGIRGKKYFFTITDDEKDYEFEYFYDSESKSIVVRPKSY